MPANTHSTATGPSTGEADASTTARPTTTRLQVSSAPWPTLRSIRDTVSDPISMPAPQTACSSPKPVVPASSDSSANRDSSGDLSPAANVIALTTRMTDRTVRLPRTYAKPSRSSPISDSVTSARTAFGKAVPATSAPEKANDSALAVKPQVEPKWSTIRPPSEKPAMIASDCVMPTMPFACVSERAGTKFGIAAMNAGWNSALPTPRTSETAYTWASVGAPPTSSDATAAARTASVANMSHLRLNRSMNGPPTSATSIPGPTCSTSSSDSCDVDASPATSAA